MTKEQIAEHRKTHQTVNGVKMVKISLNDTKESYPVDETNVPGGGGGGAPPTGCMAWPVCRFLRKSWLFARWLAGYDLYPLLSLNFFFRFAFAAYK